MVIAYVIMVHMGIKHYLNYLKNSCRLGIIIFFLGFLKVFLGYYYYIVVILLYYEFVLSFQVACFYCFSMQVSYHPLRNIAVLY